MIALHGLFGVDERDGLISPLDEKRSQEIAHREVVVDDHDLKLSIRLSCDRHADPLSNGGATVRKPVRLIEELSGDAGRIR